MQLATFADGYLRHILNDFETESSNDIQFDAFEAAEVWSVELKLGHHGHHRHHQHCLVFDNRSRLMPFFHSLGSAGLSLREVLFCPVISQPLDSSFAVFQRRLIWVNTSHVILIFGIGLNDLLEGLDIFRCCRPAASCQWHRKFVETVSNGFRSGKS